MQTDGRAHKRDERTTATLGFTVTPSEDDPRRDLDLLAAIARIAPGTELRQGVDDIIRAREGALIVTGDPSELSFLYSGGIKLDQPFTPQLLYELAKMDGAIVISSDLSRLAYANVQLMPDPSIPSSETGTRHRTAERVAKQTGAMVCSISQQRETVTVFLGQYRYQLEPIASLLAKTNQALAAVDTYRHRLQQAMTRLTALEFQGSVMLDDVLVVLQRAEMTLRMAEEIERDCVELGSEGRLIRMLLEELVAEVPAERETLVFDYHASGDSQKVRDALTRLAATPYEEVLVPDVLAHLLGYPRTVTATDFRVAPRGYRVLSHIPRLPTPVIRRVVANLDGLQAIIRATSRDLEELEGVSAARARDIRNGLRRLQEQNLLER